MSQSVDKRISDVLARTPRGAQGGALCAVADELLTAGDVDGALRCFDRALQNDAKSARAWTGRATVQAHRARFGEALGCIHRALDERGAYAPALTLEAEVLVKAGRRHEALACCRKEFAADSELAEHWIRRGRVFEDLEHLDDAADAYASALAIENTATPWFLRAQIFTARGKLEDAAHDFARAVAAEPGYFDAWYLLAQTDVELGRSTDAKFALERFLALAPAGSPHTTTARKMLADLAAPPRAPVRAAIAAAAPHETPEAPEAPEASEAPELGVAYRRPAASASRVAPPEEAVPEAAHDDELEVTRNATTGAPPPLSRPFYLDEIDALYADGKHLEALRRIGPILLRSPDHIEALLCQAKVLVALGELEVAVTSLERVTRIDRGHLFAFRLMAACWRELKRPDRALQIADRVLALAPLAPESLQLREDCLRDLERRG